MERLAIDLLAPELYGGDPYPTYAWMRANEPIYWDEVNELWGISRYDDIVEIEKRKLPAEPPGRQRHHWP
jgi:cytochrome P450 family 142 subfamily A polypeptide 1